MLEDALAAAETAFKDCGDSPPTQGEMLVLANGCYAVGRHSEASDIYQSILEDEPSNADARFNLGLAYLRLGSPEDAVRAVLPRLRLRWSGPNRKRSRHLRPGLVLRSRSPPRRSTTLQQRSVCSTWGATARHPRSTRRPWRRAPGVSRQPWGWAGRKSSWAGRAVPDRPSRRRRAFAGARARGFSLVSTRDLGRRAVPLLPGLPGGPALHLALPWMWGKDVRGLHC